ncbi:MAG: phosphoglycerate kinase [Acidobacteria bacterium]|nr:phosphoglycerate kinase [Acidobacteriota bacterium]
MKKSINDVALGGQTVFMRVDFNVPLNAEGRITDDTRIRASLPSIRLALEKGARVLLASHLGRPKGKPKPAMSLKPAADRLAELLGRPVLMAPDCVGPEVANMRSGLNDGDVLMLENVRFHAEEEANDAAFSAQLAEGIDIFVNDAFGSAHRAHASTAGITAHVKVAVSGLLMEKELRYLGGALESPTRPFVAILGGAKVSDKIGVIDNLLGKVDALLIGGAMAYTFFRAKGYATGRSLVEAEKVDMAARVMKDAESRKVPLLLPVDHVTAPEMKAGVPTKTSEAATIDAEWMGLDIGPQSITEFAGKIRDAGTVVWNGPMGVFEIDSFAAGTIGVARAVAASAATTIVGGGDSISAVEKAGVADEITHISTGGGASLEFLSGDKLPGVEALNDR